MALSNFSDAQVSGQLNSGFAWAGSVLTYRFPTNTTGLTITQGEGTAFRPATAAQQAAFVLALATWDDLIAPNFQSTTLTSANIELAYTTTGIQYAHAYYPQGGTVWLNAGEADFNAPSFGTYGFQTLVHEIGHAMGLNHMGDYNGEGAFTPSSFQDSVVLSIMSYFGPSAPLRSSEVMQADWVGADGRLYAPQTPMLNDVMVIQQMYGASTSTRSGDTVYGFGSNVTGTLAGLYDFAQNLHPILTLYDSGGTDTLNLSGWSSAAQIDLAPGAFSSANHMTNNIAIARGVTMENAVGGSGNDTIAGNSVANRLQGGGGNDQIDGGAGTDTAAYAGARAGYTVTRSGSQITVRDNAGSEGQDALQSIERLAFANGRWAYDMGADQAGGQAALLMGLLLGRASLSNTALASGVVAYFDAGNHLLATAQALVASGTIAQLAGGSDSAALVRLLHTQLLGSAPDAATQSSYAQAIDASGQGHAYWIAQLAQLDLNQQNVGLVGLAQNGWALG